MMFVGVGQLLIASILPSSVVSHWAEIDVPDRLTAPGIAHTLKA